MIRRTRDGNWFNQALRQAPWRTQTQATSLIMATVIMVAVIGTLYLAQASRTAATGRRLQELEAERQVLEQQNAQLRAEIAALQSVPRLIAEAEQQGFHMAETGDVEYLKIENVSQTLAAMPASSASSKERVPTYDETLGSWLSEQMATMNAQLGQFFNSTFGPEETPTP
jgi:cell division protein FtsL